MIRLTQNHTRSGKHYRFRIMGHGPTLLILGGSSDDWESTLELLSSHFTLIIPSLSKSVLDKQPESPDPIVYLEGLLDELAVDRYAVLAHSVSAWIGLRLAALHAQRVSKLILANLPSAIEDRPSFDQLYTVLAGKRKREQRELSSFWFDQIYSKPSEFSEAKEVLMDRPFLMITGETDRFFSREKFIRWTRLRDTDFDLAVIRFSGHFCMKDNPWYFSAIVRDFLKSFSNTSTKIKTA